MNETKKPIVIIGAGAAGLMAAATLAENKRNSIILERAPAPGRKLLVSGGGRCNFTNDRTTDDFLNAFTPPAARFLKPALYNLPPDELRKWFRRHGLDNVVEERRCVFPRSGRSRDLLNALLAIIRPTTQLQTGCQATEIIINAAADRAAEDRPAAAIGVRTADGRNIPAAAVIVATGGPAWPQAGGSSDGLELLQRCGHTITPLRCGLAPLQTAPAWWSSLHGITLHDVSLTIARREIRSSIIITHDGLSGPAALDASLLLTSLPAHITMNLLPDLAPDELEQKLINAAANNGRQSARSWLADYLPTRLADAALDAAETAHDGNAKTDSAAGTAANAITAGAATADAGRRMQLGRLPRLLRRNLVGLLTRSTVQITSLGQWSNAMVTVGGCDLRQIDPRSMQSRLVPRLYVVGEALNIAGPTGGFNIHAAFATARLAALHAAAHAAALPT